MFLMNPGMTANSPDQDRLVINFGNGDTAAADTGSVTVDEK